MKKVITILGVTALSVLVLVMVVWLWLLNSMTKDMEKLKNNFIKYLKNNNLTTARQMVLNDAKMNPYIIESSLCGDDISIIYISHVCGVVSLDDPSSAPVDTLK